MGFSPPFFAVPEMKTSSWLTNKGYMAIFMSRSRKLLHIWPIEYSGDGPRGLQTVSHSLKIFLASGYRAFFSIFCPSQSYWFEPTVMNE